MCGIVGYLGNKEALPILIGGLKNLEYRGYDSAGVVVADGSKIKKDKAVGKIVNLEEKLKSWGDGSYGKVGIAHTRWATHGGVTEVNAHPHWDCKENIFVVHNGIIENYKELKERLISRSHRFLSETDTETIPHLIEAIKSELGVPIEEAVRLTLKQIRGTYGILVFDRRSPEKIVVARNFSPLVFGMGEGEAIVASDPTAVLGITRDLIYLKDGEIAVVGAKKYRVFNIENEPIKKTTLRSDWSLETAKKGGHPHFMLKEILEEPEAVRNSIRGRLFVEEGKAILGGLKEIEEKLKDVRRILICACGTAGLMGKVGEYMLEEYAGIPTEVDIGSEFRYRKPVFQAGDIFLAISQSGETADTLGSLYEAKEKGVLTLGIVNVVGSTVSRETDAGIYQHIGPEISVASTKAAVSQLTILVLLTLFFGRKKGMSLVMGKRIAEELQKVPELIEKVLTQKLQIKKLAEKYKDYKNFLYLGRKYNLPIAYEGAMKLKEISYVHAEGYGAGEMKHGPIAMIDKNFPSVVIVPKDSVYDKTMSNIEELKARGGPVIAIATEGDERIKEVVDDVFYIPKTLEMLTPIISVVPLHLLAYYFSVAKGYDVDKPRNLAKSVTVE